MKRFELYFGVLKAPVDVTMTILGFLTAYKLRLITKPIEGFAKPIDFASFPTLNAYLQFSLSAATALLVVFALSHLYALRTTFTFSREMRKVFTAWAIWAMFIITYLFFTRTLPFSRLAFIYSWIFALVFILTGRGIIRLIQKMYLHMGIGRRNLMFIGNNSITTELYRQLKDNSNYRLIGIVGQRTSDAPLPILGSISALERIIKKKHIDEIIQTKSDNNETQDETILELCDLYHVDYRFVPDLLEVRHTNIAVETVSGIPIIGIRPTPLDGWGKVLKRIMDIIGATCALALLSPIMLLTALIIRLDSRGPIIFRHRDDGTPVMRIGQFGKPFRFYKFRTMKPNTDSLRYTALAEKNIRRDGPLVKIENDPRITRIGHFLRRTSIDELPNLWSVLKGDISLVGPRPHLPEEVANYKRHHRFVFTIKPGITGLAQISGRSDLSFEEEVKLDRYYIENWSLWLDLKIILRTFSVLGKGYRE